MRPLSIGVISCNPPAWGWAASRLASLLTGSLGQGSGSGRDRNGHQLHDPARVSLCSASQVGHLSLHGGRPEPLGPVRSTSQPWRSTREADSAGNHRRPCRYRVYSLRRVAKQLGPRFKFEKRGQSGVELAEVLPHLGEIVDDVCFVRSMRTDQFNHCAPAQIFLNTGFSQPGRPPSMGSWVTYGLGAETNDLPAFVVMSTGAGISGGAANWSGGFLPTVHSGVRFRNQGNPILDVTSPPGVDPRLQRDTLDLVGAMNHQRLDALGDPEIATRIAAYEMAYQLQTSAPELMNVRDEGAATLELYGADPDKPSFARACLLARRMVRAGACGNSSISITKGGTPTATCRATTKRTAAIPIEPRRRSSKISSSGGFARRNAGRLQGGEFGRTPMIETNAALGRSQGRDHHPQAFTLWMAGGGIKARAMCAVKPTSSASTSWPTQSTFTICRPRFCTNSASTTSGSPTATPAAISA